MSSPIFKNQGYLILKLDTGIETSILAAAASKKILFKRPDGSKGSYDATVEGTKLIYQMLNSDLNLAPGLWEFQAYCEIDTKKAFGSIFKKIVDSNLE